jgi:hypothetical protein
LNNRLDVIPSVWSDLLRCSIYKRYNSSSLPNKKDMLGFVDKDAENLLVRLDGDF